MTRFEPPPLYPWRILAECPAPTHNTLRAGQGRHMNRYGHSRCICPRAAMLYEIDLDKKRRSKRDNRIPLRPARVPRVLSEEKISATHVRPGARYEMPDFTNAECATEDGRRVHDEYIDAPGTAPHATRAARVCAACPLIDACRAWVMSAERPAGAWSGMYAGLTPRDRLRLASRQGSDVWGVPA